MMAVLAQRNLRRGVALGLPSGQGVARFFGVPALTATQLQQGLPSDEVAVLNESGGLLLRRTPLWYYVLREAALLNGGEQLGPVGSRIVAGTFVRILKRDATSYFNVSGELHAIAAGSEARFIHIRGPRELCGRNPALMRPGRRSGFDEAVTYRLRGTEAWSSSR